MDKEVEDILSGESDSEKVGTCPLRLFLSSPLSSLSVIFSSCPSLSFHLFCPCASLSVLVRPCPFLYVLVPSVRPCPFLYVLVFSMLVLFSCLSIFFHACPSFSMLVCLSQCLSVFFMLVCLFYACPSFLCLAFFFMLVLLFQCLSFFFCACLFFSVHVRSFSSLSAPVLSTFLNMFPSLSPVSCRRTGTLRTLRILTTRRGEEDGGRVVATIIVSVENRNGSIS